MEEYPILYDLSINFYSLIEQLSNQDLEKLVTECESRTDSNCWWVSYQIKKAVNNFAQNEIACRKQIKVQEKVE